MFGNKIKRVEKSVGEKKKKSWFRLLWGFIFKFIGIALLLLILAWFAIRYYPVQNFLVTEATKFLSTEMGTKVSIKHIELDFFDRVSLQGVYVEDKDAKDTLAYIGDLNADIAFFSIFEKQLRLDALDLVSPTFYYTRLPNEVDFNLQRVIDFFASKDTTKQPPNPNAIPFILSAKRLTLQKAVFVLDDAKPGVNLNVYVDKFEAVIDEFIPEQKKLRVKSLVLDKPRGVLSNRDGHALPPRPAVAPSPPDPADTVFWDIELAHGKMIDGQFCLENTRNKRDWSRQIDFQHLRLRQIMIEVEDFKMKKLSYAGLVKHLSVKEDCGFEVKKATGYCFHDEHVWSIKNLDILTPNSHLKDNLVFDFDGGYDDWSYFSDKVVLNARVNNSTLALTDVMAFVPDLEKIAFFKANKLLPIKLNGNFKGTVNSLKIKGLDIDFGGYYKFKGDIASRDLLIKNSEFVDLKCEELAGDVGNLSKILKELNLPKEVLRFGQTKFTGSYTGFIRNNFTAWGTITSQLGTVKSDVTMDFVNGLSNANYNGKINIVNFQLHKMLDNNDFGNVSLELEAKGSGFRKDNLNVKIDKGLVKEFLFKNYNYNNVTLSGLIDKFSFQGKIDSKDDNADFTFDGLADLNNMENPILSFKAGVKQIALKPLNIGQDNIVIRGDFNLEGKGGNLDNMLGRAYGRNIHLSKDSKRIDLDSVIINSAIDADNNRSISIRSNQVNGTFKGVFQPTKVPEAFLQYLEENYSGFTERLHIYSQRRIKGMVSAPILIPNIDFDVTIADIGFLNSFIGQDIKLLKNTQAKGSFSNLNHHFQFNLISEEFKVATLGFKGISLKAKNLGENLEMEARISQFNPADSFSIPNISLAANLSKDSLLFKTGFEQFQIKNFSNVLVEGSLTFFEDWIQMNLTPSEQKPLFLLDKRPWFISKDNVIRFQPNKLWIQNLELSNKEQIIKVNSDPEGDLVADINNLQLAWLEKFAPIDRLKYAGTLNGQLRAANVFSLENIEASVWVDTLFINKDNWGKLTIKALVPNLKSSIQAKKITLENQTSLLEAEGYYVLPHAPQKQKPNTLFLKTNVKNFSAKFIEYFTAPEAYNLVGKINGNIEISGPPNLLDIKGRAVISDLAATVAFLNLRYTTDKIALTVDNHGFHIIGPEKERIIKDPSGNQATIDGDITFDRFKKFGANIYITSPKIQVLNTAKNSGMPFYGKAYANVLVNFQGLFNKLEMYVNGKSLPGTFISIPLSSAVGSNENVFKFVNKKTSQNVPKIKTELSSSFDINMELSVTNDATIQLVFDERTGDIITGKGKADLNIDFKSASREFNMFGEYRITSGKYLFNWQNLINKPFDVAEGGTIKWSGDPYDAQLNLVASYSGINTSPYSLLAGTIGSDQSQIDEAKAQTKIIVDLLIKGALLKPDITFNIRMPNLSPKIKSLVDIELRKLADLNRINEQVFGLIALKTFLPSSDLNQTESLNIATSGINTLSEMLSSQLSNYLSDFISSWTNEWDALTTLDVNVGYQLNNNKSNADQQSKFSAALTPSFINGRLIVKIGANIDIRNSTSSVSGANNTSIGEDIQVEYKITKDGAISIKPFSRTESAIASTVRRYGAGISIKKDFNNIEELVAFLKKKKKKTTE